jgi:5S rRNA maturation endonuclease (ribonuclease M5)
VSALSRFVDALEASDCRPRRGEARCPGHDDRKASLSYKEGQDGRVLVKCHAGCPLEQVLAPLGLEAKDLFEPNGHREIVATYDYVDEAGKLLLQVVRFAPKDFRQRKPDGVGGWEWKLGNTRRVLYRLPRIVEAVGRGEDVMIVEGEKDADRLHALGIAATCNPMGAGKWRDEYAKPLRGAQVTIVADRDDAGRDHARQVARSLQGVADEIDIVEPAVGKDISDHLAAGKSIAELVETSPRGGVPEVDGAELLGEVKGFITTYMVLSSDPIADLLAVWVLHTHCIDTAYATPYRRVTSATRECGKTQLMEILATLTRRGRLMASLTGPTVFRIIEAERPTVLFDEIDNFSMDDHKDVLAVLNEGYKRGVVIPRCKKDTHEVQWFKPFCPKVYAGIDESRIPDTLLSRSITIRLEKALASDQLEDWIGQDCEPLAAPLGERCEQWAEAHLDELNPRPQLPAGIINRAAEVWRPLVAIADRVGGDWPARIRDAAVALATGGDDHDELDQRVQLLLDIRDAFGDERIISTEGLLAYLNALDESPWGARRRGEGLDARGLAKMLRPFRIRSMTVRIGDSTPKGYRFDQFEDTFARHLPASARQAPQAPQAPHRSADAERDVADVADVADTEPNREGRS